MPAPGRERPWCAAAPGGTPWTPSFAWLKVRSALQACRSFFFFKGRGIILPTPSNHKAYTMAAMLAAIWSCAPATVGWGVLLSLCCSVQGSRCGLKGEQSENHTHAWCGWCSAVLCPAVLCGALLSSALSCCAVLSRCLCSDVVCREIETKANGTLLLQAYP